MSLVESRDPLETNGSSVALREVAELTEKYLASEYSKDYESQREYAAQTLLKIREFMRGSGVEDFNLIVINDLAAALGDLGNGTTSRIFVRKKTNGRGKKPIVDAMNGALACLAVDFLIRCGESEKNACLEVHKFSKRWFSSWVSLRNFCKNIRKGNARIDVIQSYEGMRSAYLDSPADESARCCMNLLAEHGGKLETPRLSNR